MRIHWLAACAVCALLCLPRGATAAVLDQSYEPPTTEPGGGLSYGAIRSDVDSAQTFTVGVSGRLDRVDVAIYRQGSNLQEPLRVDVRRTVNGAPAEADSPVLASFELPPERLPVPLPNPGDPVTFTSLDLSDFDIHVEPGDVLAIVAQSEAIDAAGPVYAWRLGPFGGDHYPRGGFFQRDAEGGHFVEGTGVLLDDAGFRSYVTVPEPTAAALLVGLPYLLRRRRGRRGPP